MDGPCGTQLMTLESCVEADPATCSCFKSPFNETFPSDVGTAYRMTMAFEIPGTDEFCATANEGVCASLDVSGNCCCQTEVNDYLTCEFTSEWNIQFNAGNCEFSKCGAGEEEGGDEGGSGSMMYIIIGAVVALLLCCCCCGFFFYRRRRNAAAAAAAANKVDADSKDTKRVDDDSEHSWGDRDVESMGDKRKKKNNKRREADDDSSSSDESETRRKDRRSHKMKKSGSKKSLYDSDEDSDSDQSRGKNGKSKKKSTNRRGGYNSSSDSEDSERSESRRGNKMKRRGSKSRMDDYEEESVSYRPSQKYKNKRSNSKRGFDEEEESERPSRATVEESLRQARTIVKTIRKTEKNADGVSIEVQQVMNAELSAMIAQLKEQKQEAERRLHETQTEATKLRLEKEASQRQIAELETKTVETQKTLHATQAEARNLQANQTLVVATREAETIKVSAELEQVRKEREQMAKMIQKLELARESMQGKLQHAQHEATVLRTENTEAAKKIKEVEMERQELRNKLEQIQQTRGDVQRRLLEAELEAKELKSLKNTKTHEIREERASTHVRQSYLNEMEAERKEISKNLKKMEEEKQQMKAMKDQLDHSFRRLTSLMEDASGTASVSHLDDDNSLTVMDLMHHGNRSAASSRSTSPVPPHHARHQPTLATIQSPRQLGMPRTSSFKNLAGGPAGPDLMMMGYQQPVEQQQDDYAFVKHQHHHSAHNLFQQQQPVEVVVPQMRRAASTKSMSGYDRPSGWLGDHISNRSFNDLSSADQFQYLQQQQPQDPSQHVTDSEALRLKRAKARRSERRLRSEMDRSRGSNRSLGGSNSSFGSMGSMDP